MRKKASILLVLTIILYGCSEELSETNYNTDINLIQSEKTLEKSDDFGSSNKSNNQTPIVDNGNNAQTSELNFEIYQPEELIVYVFFYEEAFNITPTIEDIFKPSIDDSPTQNNTNNDSSNNIIEAYINNYEAEMSNNFTIHQIVESISCEYTFKWIVDKNEYYEYWGPTGPPSETGIKKSKQKPKDDGGSGTSFMDPYANCF